MKTRVKLSVITPIFIGSGDSYYPNDYFIKDNILYFLDRDKFNKKIINSNLYEEFLKASEDIDELLKFIDKYADENVSQTKADIDPDLIEKLKDHKSRAIESFIKERYSFLPFIPGSTLKGVIRTAILDYKISK